MHKPVATIGCHHLYSTITSTPTHFDGIFHLALLNLLSYPVFGIRRTVSRGAYQEGEYI
jgi:hypothetical protein